MEQYLWLIPLGFVVGAYGTLIGAGGGFVLMPVLLLLYPGQSPETITSISLAVVFFNALSGSAAYGRMRRIDYKSGLMLAAATIPGAILGALHTALIPRRLFDGVFGVIMIAATLFLLFFPNMAERKAAAKGAHGRELVRRLTEKDGTVRTFSYNPWVGTGLSVFVGYVSSLLGIGGGIVHVPLLVRVPNFPVHFATATSHFILAIMALTGTIVHISTGSFSHGVHRTIALAIGVLIGAQLGAMLSNRLQGSWILRGLAIALGFVGVRILIMTF
jgi:uncharacterized membrane protein YfcA